MNEKQRAEVILWSERTLSVDQRKAITEVIAEKFIDVLNDIEDNSFNLDDYSVAMQTRSDLDDLAESQCKLEDPDVWDFCEHLVREMGDKCESLLHETYNV